MRTHRTGYTPNDTKLSVADKKYLQEEKLRLEKLMILWNNPEFQEQFVKPTEETVRKLETSQWSLTSQDLRTLMSEFGLQVQTADNLLTLFMNVRSVVGFWENKLRPFRDAEKKLNLVIEQLREGK